MTLAADYRLLNETEYQPLRKLNFGVELDFTLLELRAGSREGYYTVGAGIDLGLVRVSAASYGVELGAYPGQIEDRRYVAEVNFRLDLDENLQPSACAADASNNVARNRAPRRTWGLS